MQKITPSDSASTLRTTAPPFTYSSNDLCLMIDKITFISFIVATEDLTHMNQYTLSTVNAKEYKVLTNEYLRIFF